MTLKGFVAHARDVVLRSGTTRREASGSPWQLRSASRNHCGRPIVQCRWFQPQLLASSIWLSPLSHQGRYSCVCSQLSDCSDAWRRDMNYCDNSRASCFALAARRKGRMLYLRNDEAMSGLIFPIGTAPPARKIALHIVVLRTMRAARIFQRAGLVPGIIAE
jgi:hypothetical protein